MYSYAILLGGKSLEKLAVYSTRGKKGKVKLVFLELLWGNGRG